MNAMCVGGCRNGVKVLADLPDDQASSIVMLQASSGEKQAWCQSIRFFFSPMIQARGIISPNAVAFIPLVQHCVIYCNRTISVINKFVQVWSLFFIYSLWLFSVLINLKQNIV